MSEKNHPGKDLLAYLEHHGLLEYGSFIPADEVRSVLNIDVPEVATRAVFQDLAMAELTAVDYVRKHLLTKGKYIGMSKGDYRILLPSENAAQIAQYMSSADRKLKRALILSKNSPITVTNVAERDNVQARILLKREGIKDKRGFGRVDTPPIPPRPPVSQRMPEQIRPS